MSQPGTIPPGWGLRYVFKLLQEQWVRSLSYVFKLLQEQWVVGREERPCILIGMGKKSITQSKGKKRVFCFVYCANVARASLKRRTRCLWSVWIPSLSLMSALHTGEGGYLFWSPPPQISSLRPPRSVQIRMRVCAAPQGTARCFILRTDWKRTKTSTSAAPSSAVLLPSAQCSPNFLFPPSLPLSSLLSFSFPHSSPPPSLSPLFPSLRLTGICAVLVYVIELFNHKPPPPFFYCYAWLYRLLLLCPNLLFVWYILCSVTALPPSLSLVLYPSVSLSLSFSFLPDWHTHIRTYCEYAVNVPN